MLKAAENASNEVVADKVVAETLVAEMSDVQGQGDISTKLKEKKLAQMKVKAQALWEPEYCPESIVPPSESLNTITKRATGERYALKTMPPDPNATDRKAAEAALLADVEMQRSLDHPNIARVVDVYRDDSSGDVSFVMPLYSGGSLVQYMRRHPCIDEAAKDLDHAANGSPRSW